MGYLKILSFVITVAFDADVVVSFIVFFFWLVSWSKLSGQIFQDECLRTKMPEEETMLPE